MKTPLIKEIIYEDPLKIFDIFANDDHIVFLHSGRHNPEYGRYSFITSNPFQILQSKNGLVKLDKENIMGNPFDVLQNEIKKYPLEKLYDYPPFQTGIAGVFSYDLYQHLEKIEKNKDELEFPDLYVGFYNSVIAFDHLEKRCYLICSGYPATTEEERLHNAENKYLEIESRLASNKIEVTRVTNPPVAIKSNFSPNDYQATIAKAVEYIYAGDIFQTNISQCFSAKLPDGFSLPELFFQINEKNAAPFSAYINFNNIAVISASPERFLSLSGKNVETRPIKGTRKRDQDPSKDEQLQQELKNSSKDNAENTMIVDLMRNDLSRVCDNRTVEVEKLCGLESYATVHHLVSVIHGKLKAEYDAIDLLKATFPGGSITGAPKIRAMEIIAELEPTARGPYCGSIGYISFNGDMDTSIVIRTYAIKENHLTFQAGGGIVADSNPLDEYEETLIKAKAMHLALNTINGRDEI